MLSSGDNIPEHASIAITITNLDRSQVRAEIPRKLIDEQALPIGSLIMPLVD
jgi:hypothetical protein